MDLPPPENTISPTLKRVLSCAILFYLCVLILGPLSNPVGSEHLTRPIAEKVSPIHRALFLGHGYRFFAPDPGPSHLVEYKITKQDGSILEGLFPDRNDDSNAFPRLQYHRWFMLSETIWTEHSLTPNESDFRVRLMQLERLATEKQIAGHHKIASRMRADIEQQKKSYANTRQRIDDLVESVAKNLLEMHGGTRVELFVREREIPYPFEVQEGAKLDEERFLKPDQPVSIGIFSADEPNTSAAETATTIETESLPSRDVGGEQ
jgi:hypothetical protein